MMDIYDLFWGSTTGTMYVCNSVYTHTYTCIYVCVVCMYVCMSCTPVQYDTKVQVPGKDETWHLEGLFPKCCWIGKLYCSETDGVRSAGAEEKLDTVTDGVHGVHISNIGTSPVN